MPYDDDFGYLQSVVETIQRGRIWTSDWLEPWGASLTVLSALAFKVSGSMTFAVQGVLALLAMCSVAPLSNILARRRYGAATSVLSAVAFLSLPPLLWKQTQFTSVAICIPALLFALLAAEQRRWVLFTLAFLPALAARQSSIAWIALPLFSAIEGLYGPNGRAKSCWIVPFVVVLISVAAYGTLGAVMNDTYAQRVMTKAMWTDLNSIRIARGLAVSASVCLTCMGIGGLLIRCFVRKAEHDGPRRSRYISASAAAALLIAFIFRDALHVQLELPLREATQDGRYLSAFLVLGVCGWAIGGFRIRAAYGAAAVAAGSLVALRGEIWDYYLLDVGVFAFLAAEPQDPGSGPLRRSRVTATAVGIALLAAALWQNWIVAARVKRVIDGCYAHTVLCEHALRVGRIRADELSIAPFGFQGWHVFPHFTRTIGRDGRYIADFTLFLRQAALRVETRAAPSDRIGEVVVYRDGPVVASGVFRAVWIETHEFELHVSAAGSSASVVPLDSDYEHRVFPLDETEWRSLAGQGVTAQE